MDISRLSMPMTRLFSLCRILHASRNDELLVYILLFIYLPLYLVLNVSRLLVLNIRKITCRRTQNFLQPPALTLNDTLGTTPRG
jgi:hypothetical protein